MTKLLDDLTRETLMTHVNETASRRETEPRHDGVATGKLTGFTDAGEALIRSTANRGNLVARSAVALTERDIGCEVALVFENGDYARPIVLGVLRTCALSRERITNAAPFPFELDIDEERVELRAKQKIVLRCGSASVTMTHEGRIIIRGTDILSRSTGLNRIKGGAVQIN